VYGTGHSEEVVAQALKEWQGAKPYIFTKCSLVWDDQRKVRPEHSAASIRSECEASLRRLQLSHIDLYQMHWPPPDNGPGLEEAWQTMATLQKEARFVGSVFPTSMLKNSSVPRNRAREFQSASLLPDFRARSKPEILPYCKKQGIGVISLLSHGLRLIDRTR